MLQIINIYIYCRAASGCEIDFFDTFHCRPATMSDLLCLDCIPPWVIWCHMWVILSNSHGAFGTNGHPKLVISDSVDHPFENG